MMPATAALSRALVATSSNSRISPLAPKVRTVSRTVPLGVSNNDTNRVATYSMSSGCK
jgi:hypothetical protein